MYNGWANYETWCFDLWLNNEEPYYKTVLDCIRDVKRECTGKRGRVLILADELKELYEAYAMPRNHTGLASDLLGHAKSHIDFEEIARCFIEEFEDVDV